MFTPDQIQELIRIIQFNHIIFGIDMVGAVDISTDDTDLLKKFGIDYKSFKFPGMSQLEQAFHFGRLASALGNVQTKTISYPDFRKFVQAGGHRPLTVHEEAILKSIKTQSFNAVKGLGNKISDQFTQVVGATEAKRRASYEKILREELSEGVINKKSVAEIVLDLGRKSGDWERDLGRLVETEMHNAYEEGRASTIQDKYGADAKVFKDVYPGACRHCIRLYLTSGIGSEPIIFKLSTLRENGTNVGRKPEDWKAVVGSTHPFCRCTMHDYDDAYEWNPEKRAFSTPKEGYKFKHEFSVTVNIGGKDYTV